VQHDVGVDQAVATVRAAPMVTSSLPGCWLPFAGVLVCVTGWCFWCVSYMYRRMETEDTERDMTTPRFSVPVYAYESRFPTGVKPADAPPVTKPAGVRVRCHGACAHLLPALTCACRACELSVPQKRAKAGHSDADGDDSDKSDADRSLLLRRPLFHLPPVPSVSVTGRVLFVCVRV